MADLWKNTHQQVKAKILERLGEWTEMFSKDPDLGIMSQAYNKLKSQSNALGHYHATYNRFGSRSWQIPTSTRHPSQPSVRSLA
jgi:hypothetical protein